ncbi:WD40/YVTN/BNR-like repeat-containing protein [Pseudoduganella lutea]|uniref:WD40/YVTN/BNR-like repeat-containing protein n=1 Tax=Pseudoduganella lutea TaxID=321985 RepID=UPI0013EE7BD9|nr:YCF48-related protein [Pseudoduganella lutea]
MSTVNSAARVADVLDRPAAQDRQPASRVMLGLDRHGKRTLAVGERGLVLVSDDDGKAWRQARVPVSVTLTAVRFVTPDLAWAIGHGGVVLHTEDGGATWRRQLDGRGIIRLLESAARGNEALAATARQFAADGPDKPLLDLHFYDAKRGIVAGAYGLVLRTEDGGATWQVLNGATDNPDGLHVYAIAVRGEETWLAGEQGYIARSLDGGRAFTRVQAPYRGTWFTARALPDGGLLFAGLRGNAWRWNGQGFEQLAGYAPVSLAASATAPGGVLLADQAGHLYRAGTGQQPARMVRLTTPPSPIAAMVATAGGDVLVAGVRGVSRISATVLEGGAP